MENLNIQNSGNEMILRINRKGFDAEYLLTLVKRLKIEEIAKKARFSKKILGIADKIDKNWWRKNATSFLKNVEK